MWALALGSECLRKTVHLWEVWASCVNAHCGGHTFCSIYVCFVLSTPKNKQQGPVLKIEKVEEISLPFEAILHYWRYDDLRQTYYYEQVLII